MSMWLLKVPFCLAYLYDVEDFVSYGKHRLFWENFVFYGKKGFEYKFFNKCNGDYLMYIFRVKRHNSQILNPALKDMTTELNVFKTETWVWFIWFLIIMNHNKINEWCWYFSHIKYLLFKHITLYMFLYSKLYYVQSLEIYRISRRVT